MWNFVEDSPNPVLKILLKKEEYTAVYEIPDNEISLELHNTSDSPEKIYKKSSTTKNIHVNFHKIIQSQHLNLCNLPKPIKYFLRRV